MDKFGHFALVNLPVCDVCKVWDTALVVQHHMDLNGSLVLPELGPIKHLCTQWNDRCIHQKHLSGQSCQVSLLKSHVLS